MTRLVALMRIACAGLLGAGLGPAVAAQGGAASVLEPSTATYQVEYRGINAGTIAISLRAEEQGKFVYESRANARGLARLVVHNEVLESSTFVVAGDGLRPLSYVLDDGSADTSRDTRLDFDWQAGIARGQHENTAIELPLTPGLQDRMSVQVLIMQKLAAGLAPERIEFIDRDAIKAYVYRSEGTASLKTPLGTLDTVVYTSTREGSSRLSRVWYAPSLGFLPARAEQVRNGKVETVLTLQKVERQ